VTFKTFKTALNIPVSSALDRLSLVITKQDAVPLGLLLPYIFLSRDLVEISHWTCKNFGFPITSLN